MFPDYSMYDNVVDAACSDLTDKLTKVIKEIAPLKTACKNNTSEWVADEI